MRLNKVLGAFFRWVIVPAAYVLFAFLLLPVLLLLFAMISSRETGQDILITPPGVEEKIPSEVAYSVVFSSEELLQVVRTCPANHLLWFKKAFIFVLKSTFL